MRRCHRPESSICHRQTQVACQRAISDSFDTNASRHPFKEKKVSGRSTTLAERRFFKYRFGTTEFDERQRVLSINGKFVNIRPQQQALLSAFPRRAGYLLDWETLIDEARPPHAGLDYRAVRMAVLRLRANLGDNSRFLQTESRLGYRFTGTRVY